MPAQPRLPEPMRPHHRVCLLPAAGSEHPATWPPRHTARDRQPDVREAVADRRPHQRRHRIPTCRGLLGPPTGGEPVFTGHPPGKPAVIAEPGHDPVVGREQHACEVLHAEHDGDHARGAGVAPPRGEIADHRGRNAQQDRQQDDAMEPPGEQFGRGSRHDEHGHDEDRPHGLKTRDGGQRRGHEQPCRDRSHRHAGRPGRPGIEGGEDLQLPGGQCRHGQHDKHDCGRQEGTRHLGAQNGQRVKGHQLKHPVENAGRIEIDPGRRGRHHHDPECEQRSERDSRPGILGKPAFGP